MSDFHDEMVSIDLTEFFTCCICLDENLTDGIEALKLNCCNQYIHKMCFIDWVLTKVKDITCPICRKHILNLKEFITLEDILDNLCFNYPKNTKKKIDNANSIIQQLWYINEENGNRIDLTLETTNTQTQSNQDTYIINFIFNKLITSIIIIILLSLFIFSIDKTVSSRN